MSIKSKKITHAQIDRLIGLSLAVGREIGHLGGVRLISAKKAMERGHISPLKIYDGCKADIGSDLLNSGFIAPEHSPALGVECCGLKAISGYLELKRIYGKEWIAESLNLFFKSAQCPIEHPMANPKSWLKFAELCYRAIKFSDEAEHEKSVTDADIELIKELRASAT